MGFTNEEFIEEILYTAHNEGKYIKLIKKVEKMREKGSKRPTCDIYYEAWKKIKNKS